MSVTIDLDARFRAAAVAEGLVDVRYDVVASPVGELHVAATDRGLCRISYHGDEWEERLARGFGLRVLRSPLDDVRRELEEYFDGRRRAFDLPIDLRVAEFPATVLRELARVPYGETDTYGKLAARAGRPRAARAVGTIMNRNPIPIVLPCHRIVGGGFGGLAAARKLRRADVDVTLIDRQNFFLFQPLVYQVATGSLSSVEVAIPLRNALRRQKNARVLLGEVTAVDLEARTVTVADLPDGSGRTVPYDALAVAGGSHYSYFGHDDWTEHAPELKTLDGALELRDRILLAFEAAEVETDAAEREAWLTFVVVGAGPTGVEMAGQIAELSRDVLPAEYRDVDTRRARVLLVEATGKVLAAYGERLSASAEKQLRSLGVTPMLDSLVTEIDAAGVTLASGERIAARTKIWAAGVAASSLAKLLADAAGAELDRAGRIVVEPDLTIAGHREVFAFGDMVSVRGQDLHGVAPVAMQEGRHVARSIREDTRTPFSYNDKGELATIGRARAVGFVKGVPVTGFVAWALWLGIHIVYLVGLQNRLVVLTRWAFAYLTRGRGARVIHRG